MEEINWSFVKSCDKVIGELAYEDMLRAQPKKRSKTGNIHPYSLSQNTQYLQDTKNAYTQGKITEEEAKHIFLRQKMCGNAI